MKFGEQKCYEFYEERLFKIIIKITFHIMVIVISNFQFKYFNFKYILRENSNRSFF